MWRTVVVRLELLRSLLNVDLVGFLMFEYTRNFLTCCKRMLALEHEFQKGGALGIEYEGRHVMLQVCTFGISPQQLEARLDKVPVEPPSLGPGTLWEVCSGGRVVIGAIDYLDRLKGVAPKLLAWEALLRDYPHYRKGHVLVQVCVGARNRIQIKTAPAVESELRRIVERINAAYPGTVHFEVTRTRTPTLTPPVTPTLTLPPTPTPHPNPDPLRGALADDAVRAAAALVRDVRPRDHRAARGDQRDPA